MNRQENRAFIWCAIYYLLNTIAMCYLTFRAQILNWDTLLVFLPLLFLAFSSESLIKAKENNLYPYSAIDFLAKGAAFIFAQLVYRRLMTGLVWIPIVLFILCIALSLFCEYMMKKKNMQQK